MLFELQSRIFSQRKWNRSYLIKCKSISWLCCTFPAVQKGHLGKQRKQRGKPGNNKFPSKKIGRYLLVICCCLSACKCRTGHGCKNLDSRSFWKERQTKVWNLLLFTKDIFTVASASVPPGLSNSCCNTCWLLKWSLVHFDLGKHSWHTNTLFNTVDNAQDYFCGC